MNARRYFMIIKQMFKYIDENQTIRFLIAECDYALTVMTALYFSKLLVLMKKLIYLLCLKLKKDFQQVMK